MIYKPQETLKLRNFLWAGLVKALTALAADFNAGTNKPWTYYLGVGIGGACAATGVPGAAATAYVIAATLDIWIFKSPDGSIVKFYVNGLQRAVVDASSPTSGWIKVTLDTNTGGQAQVDIVNGEPGVDNTSGISWMAISQLESGGIVLTEEDWPVSLFQASIGVKDADGNPRTMPLYASLGTLTLTQIAGYLQRAATLTNNVIEGKVTGINLTLDVDLPSGLRANPLNHSNVQEGALFDFGAANTTYKYGLWVPAFRQDIMVGKEVDTADTDVSNFVNFLITGEAIGGATVQGTDRYENDLQALLSAVKRFRK